MHPKHIAIQEYTYQLPDNRVADFPLPERDASRLLIYKNEVIQEDLYKNIAQYLPANSLLVFNDTRVIPARILFEKITGGIIEIFCLEPYGVHSEYSTVMAKKESAHWKCLIGGAGKWKQGNLVKRMDKDNQPLSLSAR